MDVGLCGEGADRQQLTVKGQLEYSRQLLQVHPKWYVGSCTFDSKVKIVIIFVRVLVSEGLNDSVVIGVCMFVNFRAHTI